jgi:hydrogenase expression/formation protein HypE
MLGLDPFYIADEGKLVAIVVPESYTNRVLTVMKRNEYGKGIAIIGRIVGVHKDYFPSESAD